MVLTSICRMFCKHFVSHVDIILTCSQTLSMTLFKGQLSRPRLRSSARGRHVGNTRVFFLWTKRRFSSRRSLNQYDGVHRFLFALGCPARSKLSVLHEKPPRENISNCR